MAAATSYLHGILVLFLSMHSFSGHLAIISSECCSEAVERLPRRIGKLFLIGQVLRPSLEEFIIQ